MNEKKCIGIFIFTIFFLQILTGCFEEERIVDNLMAVIEAVVRAKPSGVKGQYIKSAFVTTTMGPGIKLDLRTVTAMAAS